MNQKKHQTGLFSKHLIKLVLCFFLSYCPFISIAQEYLIFSKETESQILDKVSSSLNIVFNFNSSILSTDKHSFSVYGDEKEILNLVSQKIKIEFVLLEKGIYAVRRPSIEEEIIEPEIIFGVQNQSGEELAFATVYHSKLDLVLQTDQKGQCTLKGFISDKDILSISYLGYEKEEISIGELKSTGMVVLKTGNHVLDEIVLTDFLNSVNTNELQNQSTIQDVPVAGIADQDLLRKAQLLPGIHSSSESLNDLQIRGGPPDQVSYKWNDIRLLQTSLFYGQVSAVNPFMVDEVAITRNGTSADKSGQASGSILLKSSRKLNAQPRLKFFSDFLYSNIGVDIPIIQDKLSLKVAYRKSNNFLFESRVYRNYFDQTFQFGQLANDQFYIDFFDIRGQEEIEQTFNFDDITASVNWKPSSKSYITASFIDLSNRFQYTYFDGLFSNDTKRDQLKLSNTGWNITGEYKFTDALKTSLSYNRSNYLNDYSFISNINTINEDDRFKFNTVKQNTLKAELQYEHKFFDVEVGAQNENWDVQYSDTTRVPSLGLFYDKTSVTTEEQSLFAKVKWKFIPNTIIETGVRYSDFGFSLIDRKFIEPRIHLSHNLKNRLTLHAHFGLFHQNLNRRMFFSSLDVEKGVWYLSDERPESNNFIWVVQNQQSSIGLKYLKGNWKFTMDAYTKKAQNIWTSALDFAIEEDPFAFADLRIRGIEFSTHYQNENLKLLWTYERTEEIMTIKTENPYEIRSPFTQPHRLSMMQSYAHKNWLFSSRWRFNSGRRYSEGARLSSIEEPEFQYIIEYNSILEKKISAYHSLDLSANYKWVFNKEKKRSLEIGLHLQNVYNRQNVIKRQYFIDYTKSPFEMSFYDRRGLGFTPNVSVLLNI